MQAPVLLVESDEASRAAHREVLRRAGYEVVEARTGEEAIWAVFRERPCAVVMECSIPGVSGLRATEVLKGEPRLRDLPIILLASTRDPEEQRRAFEARCDVYLAERESFDPVVEAVHWLTRGEWESAAGTEARSAS